MLRNELVTNTCDLLTTECYQIDLIHYISKEIPFKSYSADYPAGGADVIWEREGRKKC